MHALIAGSFLHDIGKIGIPDAILLKAGQMDDEERSVMRTHVCLGEEIVRHRLAEKCPGRPLAGPGHSVHSS